MSGRTLAFAGLVAWSALAPWNAVRAQSPPPSTVAASAAATAPAAPPAGVTPTAPAEAFKPPPGWRLRKGDGDEPRYCRKEVPTGSRFERWRCLSREQLVQLEAIDRDNRAEMTQGVRMCTSSTTWCKSK